MDIKEPSAPWSFLVLFPSSFTFSSCHKSQILTAGIQLPKAIGKTFPIQVMDLRYLPTCSYAWDLHPEVHWAAVQFMIKDMCCATMKYLPNAVSCQDKLFLFLLDQKQLHLVNQAVLPPVPNYSHCLCRRKTLHSNSWKRHFLVSVKHTYITTWLFSNIYGSQLPPIHYTTREENVQ